MITTILTIIAALLIIGFVWAFALGACRMAAPADEHEQLLDDEAQLKYIEEYMRERLKN